jgi:hypothetical protein
MFPIQWTQFRGKLLFLFTHPDTQYDIHVVNTKNHGFNSVGFTTICSLYIYVLWVRIPLMARGTTLSDNVYQWIAVSSTNKTDRHDMTEILLREWASMLENNERTCTTRMGEYLWIERGGACTKYIWLSKRVSPKNGNYRRIT